MVASNGSTRGEDGIKPTGLDRRRDDGVGERFGDSTLPSGVAWLRYSCADFLLTIE